LAFDRKKINNIPTILQIEKEEKEKYIKAWKQGVYRKSGTWVTIQSQDATKLADYISQFNIKWKMLDLGCGNGITVKMLRERGFDVKGVDITLEAIKEKEGFYEAPLWRLPFKDNEFDLTISTDVLEHLPTDLVNKAIEEIFRITKIKTFHCIATFMDTRDDVILHQTVKPIKWWRERFERLNAKKLDLKVVDRKDFLNG